jgi:hypothetical protein
MRAADKLSTEENKHQIKEQHTTFRENKTGEISKTDMKL